MTVSSIRSRSARSGLKIPDGRFNRVMMQLELDSGGAGFLSIVPPKTQSDARPRASTERTCQIQTSPEFEFTSAGHVSIRTLNASEVFEAEALLW